jgi:hypothetical protein
MTPATPGFFVRHLSKEAIVDRDRRGCQVRGLGSVRYRCYHTDIEHRGAAYGGPPTRVPAGEAPKG